MHDGNEPETAEPAVIAIEAATVLWLPRQHWAALAAGKVLRCDIVGKERDTVIALRDDEGDASTDRVNEGVLCVLSYPEGIGGVLAPVATGIASNVGERPC